MLCTKCGTKNEDNNAFCKNCGAKLVKSATGSQSAASDSKVAQTHAPVNVMLMAGGAVIAIIAILVVGYLNVTIKKGKEEFSDGAITEYSAMTGTDGDILSLDTDDITVAENYLDSSMETASNTEEAGATIIEQEVPSEAVLSASVSVSSLAGAKLLKEQTRAQNKESLMEIINNEDLTEEAKREAVNSMLTLIETEQKEADTQMLLDAKGFQTIVTISGDLVDVEVEAANLTEKQIEQIIDIVQNKTNIAPENIVITVSGVQDE